MQFKVHIGKSTMSLIQCIGVFVAILIFLYIHYWRRNRDEIIPNWPIIGMVPTCLRHLSNFHDHATLILKHHGGTFLFEGPLFTNTSFIVTADPTNVDHITAKNFGNYGKGSKFQEIFDFFGGGIINSDSHDWKQKRTMYHSILKRKSFKNLFKQTVQKKLDGCLLPFIADVFEAGGQVDLQDAFSRFTFDSLCTIVFGFDPNCLPNKFSELREIPYQNSLTVIEEVILFRHFIPRCLWKLQKWLNVGHEKKFREAQENLDRFLYESITFSKQEQSMRKRNNDEEMDECYFDWVNALMMDEMGEKCLRDTILNLLIAGNGTISSGLSWFFWLVSTHPVVEARIVQEIKDNCRTENENWITSRVEDLDKLVYLHGAIFPFPLSLKLGPLFFIFSCQSPANSLVPGAMVTT